MNTEAMPLKHDHYQQQCGANPPIEEKAPFLATRTTPRRNRAALGLCVVAAVVVGVTFLSGHIPHEGPSYDQELVDRYHWVAADGVLRESSSTTETGMARGGGDDEVGCADLRADGGYSFQLKGQEGCFANGPHENFQPGEYGCIITESAPFGPDGGPARGKCFVSGPNNEFGCYCCRDGGSATPEGFFPYETVGNPVPNCTVF